MPDMKRIHIVGCGPRSGTTLIAEMMVICFDIDLHTDHEARLSKWPPRRANIFLTKKPSDILVVDPLLRIMPNLYVICMVRDPRDMIVSKHGIAPDRYWSNLNFWKIYTPHAFKLQSHPRFVTIRYEDLVTQPDQVQEELLKKIPFLVKRIPFSRYHELAHPSKRSLLALGEVRPISPSSIGNWRKHLPRVAGQLQIHGSITEDLIAYGYEKDVTWEHVLDGVAPDINPSHWPESHAEAKQRRHRRHIYVKTVMILLRNSWLLLTMRDALRAVSKKARRLFQNDFSGKKERG